MNPAECAMEQRGEGELLLLTLRLCLLQDTADRNGKNGIRERLKRRERERERERPESTSREE
jgi:hypothetical protein